MSQNRLWAVCRDDGECLVLSKAASDGYGVLEPAREDWLAFTEKHGKCSSAGSFAENIKVVDEIDDDRVAHYYLGRPARIILKPCGYPDECMADKVAPKETGKWHHEDLR